MTSLRKIESEVLGDAAPSLSTAPTSSSPALPPFSLNTFIVGDPNDDLAHAIGYGIGFGSIGLGAAMVRKPVVFDAKSRLGGYILMGFGIVWSALNYYAWRKAPGSWEQRLEEKLFGKMHVVGYGDGDFHKDRAGKAS